MKSRQESEIKGRKIMARIGAAMMLLLFLLVMAGGNSCKVKAAGANIQIATKNQRVQVGDTVYVVITVSSGEEMCGFEGFFSYDNRLLKFETGGNIVYGNDNEFQISDIARETTSKVLKYSIKFTARKAGTTSINMSKPYNAYGASISEKLSVSYNGLTLLITEKEGKTAPPSAGPTSTASVTKMPQTEPQGTAIPSKTKPQLASLTVSGVALSPEFSSNIYKYSGKIQSYDTKLDIQWKTKRPEEQVIVKGNDHLEQGKNILKVVVKNAAGEKTVYKLTIKIEEPEASAAPVQRGISAIVSGKEIVVWGTESICVKSPKKEDIPEGYGKTQLEIDGQVVEAYSLESDTQHSYVLLYGSAAGKEMFYLYDREEESLYPYDYVKAWYRSTEKGVVHSEQSALQNSNKRLKYIVGIFVTISALLLLAVLSLYMKMKGMNPDEIE